MFTVPDLPYPYDALQPMMSEQTLHVHHDKHHVSYVETLNKLLQKAGQTPTSLEDVISQSATGGPDDTKVFNSAAQAWNHAFFWQSMTPDAVDASDDMKAAIEASFGGLSQLREQFVDEGVAHFGSGWLWLLATDGKLSVQTTHDARNVLTHAEITPLLVCDLWEHAYYLDYQNDRKGFLGAWFDAAANWRFAAAQLRSIGGGCQPWRYEAPLPFAKSA